MGVVSLIWMSVIVIGLTLQNSATASDQRTYDATQTVELDLPGMGKIRGYKTSDDIGIFKGIPYAQPPIGNNRWRPPVPFSSWEGVLNATDFQSSCWNSIRLGAGSVKGPTSEDCLYLNIWVPNISSVQNSGHHMLQSLPVHVYLHGGGFLVGSASQPVVSPDPESFVKATNAVYVNLNYRLGPFGFMAHPGAQTHSPEISKLYTHSEPWHNSSLVGAKAASIPYGKGFPVNSGNGFYGMQDQLLALRWIQTYIKQFNGDPDQVTVTGNSAGAFSLCLHLVNPAASGLFRSVIMQSPMCDFPFPTRSEAHSSATKLSTAVKCSRQSEISELERVLASHKATTSTSNTIGLQVSNDVGELNTRIQILQRKELDCMRQVDAKEINYALPTRRGVMWWTGEMWFPVVNGIDIPAHPRHLVGRGFVLPDVSIVAGNVRDEATLFFLLGFPLYLARDHLHDILKATHGKERHDIVWDWYEHHGIHPTRLELGPVRSVPPSEELTHQQMTDRTQIYESPLGQTYHHPGRNTSIPGPGDMSPSEAGARLISDVWHCSTLRHAREWVWARYLQLMASCHRQNISVPKPSSKEWSSDVYLYHQTHLPSWLKWPVEFLGAYHGSELILLFQNHGLMNENEVQLSKDMVQLYKSIIWDRRPMSPRNTWEPISISSDAERIIRASCRVNNKDNVSNQNQSKDEIFPIALPLEAHAVWNVSALRIDANAIETISLHPAVCIDIWDQAEYNIGHGDLYKDNCTSLSNSMLSVLPKLPLPEAYSKYGCISVPPALAEPLSSKVLNVYLFLLINSAKDHLIIAGFVAFVLLVCLSWGLWSCCCTRFIRSKEKKE